MGHRPGEVFSSKGTACSTTFSEFLPENPSFKCWSKESGCQNREGKPIWSISPKFQLNEVIYLKNSDPRASPCAILPFSSRWVDGWSYMA